MKYVLPRWRRVAGWVAYVFSGMLLCLFLFLAFRYAQGWGWTLLLAAWILWFAIFLGGIWLAEWCWKPRPEAEERRQ
jgi:peptidoglycan/LPS O-acetylase OafA/YrhL